MTVIVTGVHDADSSVRLLERALAEAETTHRPLQVVTAWSLPTMTVGLTGLAYAGPLDTEPIAQEAQRLAGDVLEKALVTRPTATTVVATAVAESGDPGQVLVAHGTDAGLTVVGGRRHGSLVSALLGSTTSYVLHQSRGPVMVVPDSAAPGPFTRIIVGVDGEACSRSALRWAFDAAARHRCPLYALHANNVLVVPGTDTVYPDYDAVARSWLKDEITLVLPEDGDVEVHSEVITGPASRVLLTDAGPDDVLVVGSRGRGGFADLVLGSVATQCAAHARGAVVVVRAGQERLG